MAYKSSDYTVMITFIHWLKRVAATYIMKTVLEYKLVDVNSPGIHKDLLPGVQLPLDAFRYYEKQYFHINVAFVLSCILANKWPIALKLWQGYRKLICRVSFRKMDKGGQNNT